MLRRAIPKLPPHFIPPLAQPDREACCSWRVGPQFTPPMARRTSHSPLSSIVQWWHRFLLRGAGPNDCSLKGQVLNAAIPRASTISRSFPRHQSTVFTRFAPFSRLVELLPHNKNQHISRVRPAWERQAQSKCRSPTADSTRRSTPKSTPL